MDIICLGDIHGIPLGLSRPDQRIIATDVIGIQVGDFGWFPNVIPFFEKVNLHHKWYFIRGNHECHPLLLQMTEPTEVLPNLIYVPDGTVLELAGMKIGFLGGAGSIDKKWRTWGKDWFPEEELSTIAVERLKQEKTVDMLITHTPPQCVIDRNFDPREKLNFSVNINWRDDSAWKVEDVWNTLGCPPLICGHMHKSLVDGNVRILAEAETYVVPREE